MNSIRYLIFTFCFFFLFNVNVNAVTCDNGDISRLKKIADNVEVSYTFNVDYVNEYGEKTYDDFNLDITGITDEIYVYFEDVEGSKHFTYNDTTDGAISFNSYSSGEYEIFIASSNCGGLLRKVEIKIPVFNRFSLDSRCNEAKYSNLDICDMWNQEMIYVDVMDLDYYFDGDSTYNNVIENIVRDNYMYLIVVGIVIVGLIIIFVFRQRKRWSLE